MSSNGFCRSSKPESGSKGRRKAGQIPGPCQRAEKVVKYLGNSDTNGTVPKSLEKKPEKQAIRGRIETTQTTALLKSARIHRRVEET